MPWGPRPAITGALHPTTGPVVAEEAKAPAHTLLVECERARTCCSRCTRWRPTSTTHVQVRGRSTAQRVDVAGGAHRLVSPRRAAPVCSAGVGHRPTACLGGARRCRPTQHPRPRPRRGRRRQGASAAEVGEPGHQRGGHPSGPVRNGTDACTWSRPRCHASTADRLAIVGNSASPPSRITADFEAQEQVRRADTRPEH